MKNLIFIALFFTSFVVSFGQTKLVIDRRDGKKDSIAVNTISQISFKSAGIYQPSILDVLTVLDSAQYKFIEYANLTNGDYARSLELTELWLFLRPDVSSVYSIDEGYITINLKSGLRTTFYIDEIDDNGNSLFRGGSGGGLVNSAEEFVNNAKEILSRKVIENKKVLLFEAATDLDLEPQIKATTDILVNSGLDLQITVLKYRQCTAEAVETFKDYGLVFIDTHGIVDGFKLGVDIDISNVPKNEESVKTAINNQLGSGTANKISSGKIQLAASIKANPKKSDWVKSLKPIPWQSSCYLSGKYIQTLPPMPGTVIVGNMCYSGWVLPSYTHPETSYRDINRITVHTIPGYTETFENAVGISFIGRNPISYYGYTKNEIKGTSRKVSDDFCKKMEDSFAKRIAKEKDSTGIVHLKPDNKTEYFEPGTTRYPGDLYFRHYGLKDYSYIKCGDTLKDTRDQQKYLTVCIGKQNWMAQNLNYNAPGSITYGNNPANGPIYGRLYDYKTIMQGANSSNANPSGVTGICPKGWHVPSNAEFLTLFETVGFDTAGGALKAKVLWDAPNTGATNSSGFTGLPGGFTSDIANSASSLNLGKMADFATTTNEGGSWVLWNLVYDGSDIQGTSGSFDKWGVSCRCVKD